jgi:hypothetical protein
MANGTWYRGEGVNIPPAQAGKMTHDLADGLYFADTLDGAKPFARRAPDPADQRLYQVKVDLSSMTVLNLSTDKRWENYMKEPVSPAGGGAEVISSSRCPRQSIITTSSRHLLRPTKSI